MKRENEERLYTTLDAYRAGFLKLKGHIANLVVELNNKIVFSFPLTEELLNDLMAYESGAKVDAFAFSLAVKSLKSQIYSSRREKTND